MRRRKLVYWVARHREDSNAYSIRKKTRRACEAERQREGADRYDTPRKIEVSFTDTLDLVRRALGEGGIE